MGLRDLQIPTSKVQVADEFFTVRGLSPNDAMGLYYRHTGELSNLFDEVRGAVEAGVMPDQVEVAQTMVSGAPQIMAEIIAIASGGDPKDVVEFEADIALALKLPAGVQVDALKKVADLTFTSDMPPGKFLDLVLKMARSTQVALSRRA